MRLLALTMRRGAKADLARELGIHRQTVSLWLSDSLKAPMPSAGVALWLDRWAEAQEKTNSGDRAVTRPPQQPKKGKSANEKPTSGQKNR